MSLTLTKASKKDLSRIANIWNQNKHEQTNNGREMTAPELEKFSEYGYEIYVVTEHAFAVIKREYSGLLIFSHFGVDKTQRGKGIGKEICKLVEQFARKEGFTKIKATVRADNPIAQVVFLKAGYRIVRVNYHQFNDGMDEVEFEQYL